MSARSTTPRSRSVPALDDEKDERCLLILEKQDEFDHRLNGIRARSIKDCEGALGKASESTLKSEMERKSDAASTEGRGPPAALMSITLLFGRD